MALKKIKGLHGNQNIHAQEFLKNLEICRIIKKKFFLIQPGAAEAVFAAGGVVKFFALDHLDFFNGLDEHLRDLHRILQLLDLEVLGRKYGLEHR